ncbi:MAG: hypothetical protein GY941_22165 [Planctomycetes bacterium]|nr:hypothetical protein [Planctomycetota bacterium]
MRRSDLFTELQLAHYQDNPLDFIEDFILVPQRVKRGENLFLADYQEDLIELLNKNRRVAISSGRGAGKTTSLALLAIWFQTVFSEAKVILTAPSSKTLKSATFPEIKKWLVGSGVGDLYEMTSERIYLKEDPSGNSFIELRTASKESPENMSGLHSPNMLFLADESSMIDPEVFRTLLNTMTFPNNKMLAISNPTRNSGFFYDIFHDDPRGMWQKRTISCIDSPFTSSEQINEMKLKWGEDSDIFKIDVLGEFPSADPNSFITATAIEEAMGRQVLGTYDIQVGVDVARYGSDKTVLFWREGNLVHEPTVASNTSIPDVVNLTIDLVKEIRAKTRFEGKIKVKVDDNGLGGGATDYLELDRENNMEVYPCNFGGKGNDQYGNEASIMWGNLRDKMGEIQLPNYRDCSKPQVIRLLREELAARRADYDTGKIKIESKKVFKRDYGRSPDFADALVLCFFEPRAKHNVVRDFDPLDTNVIPRKPSYLNGYDIYGSLYYTADRHIAFVKAYWGNGQLIITSEYAGNDNIGIVASHILNCSPTGYRRLIGNDKCFVKQTSMDIRGQLRRAGVGRIRHDKGYNDLGAMELLNHLYDNKCIKILEQCDRSVNQLYQWNLEDHTNAELGRDFGLCYAILGIVYHLKDQIKPRTITRQHRVAYEEKQDNLTLDNMRRAHVNSFLH